ncbi:MAG: hypothetical protein AAFR96_02860 [Planctomycetota bacterium]
MAARTSAGFGMIFAVSLLGLLSAAGFVTFLVQFSDNGKLQQQLNDQEAAVREIVRSAERSDPNIAADLAAAGAEGQSLVGYLTSQLNQTYSKVTGNRRDRFAALEAKSSAIEGADAGDLLSVIRGLRSENESTRQARDAAVDARDDALRTLRENTDRVEELEQSQRQTVARLQTRIDEMQADAQRYRDGLDGVEDRYAQELSATRASAEESERALQQQISGLQQRNLILEDEVSSLREQVRGSALTPKDESTLVDGTVVNTNPARNEVFISQGRRQNVVLGMTFEVYADAAQIRVDEETGELPRGKASVEVVNVGETSSRCRVLRELQGNPVVRGDVIANALYDPDKVYVFLVAGNFDTNGDRQATPAERAEIEALVEEWGGRTTQEFTGDVDFLVLGAPPVLPPQPGVTSPIALVEQYIRKEAELKRYNDLLDQAARTSVPVLNENRLYTLIGRVQSAIR